MTAYMQPDIWYLRYDITAYTIFSPCTLCDCIYGVGLYANYVAW